MADLKEVVSKALSFLDSKGKTIVLKAEQEMALYSLLEGNDALAVLPTGFGKTMIFTMFFCCCSRTNTAGTSFSIGNIAAQQHNHRPNR